MAILRDHARRAGRPNAARDIAECVANDLRANRIL